MSQAELDCVNEPIGTMYFTLDSTFRRMIKTISVAIHDQRNRDLRLRRFHGFTCTALSSSRSLSGSTGQSLSMVRLSPTSFRNPFRPERASIVYPPTATLRCPPLHKKRFHTTTIPKYGRKVRWYVGPVGPSEPALT